MTAAAVLGSFQHESSLSESLNSGKMSKEAASHRSDCCVVALTAVQPLSHSLTGPNESNYSLIL